MSGPLEQLRRRLAPAEGFEINRSRLETLASRVGRVAKPLTPFGWDDPTFYPPDGTAAKDVSQFFALGNAINFRYWVRRSGGRVLFPAGNKGAILCSGSRFMWRCLRVATEKDRFPLLDAKFLEHLKLRDAKEILSTDEGTSLIPAIVERVTNLRNLGSKLRKDWDGEFFNVARAADSSLEKFASLSLNFRAYDDPLAKLTMVNAIMHEGRGLVKFRGEFLPGIDYHLVKQIVRQGVVVPPPIVREKLRSYALLTESEAAALRSTTLYALLEIARTAGVRGDVLDNLYWSNGRRCDDSAPVCMIRGRERECPFLDPCDKEVDFRIPLELTRYY